MSYGFTAADRVRVNKMICLMVFCRWYLVPGLVLSGPKKGATRKSPDRINHTSNGGELAAKVERRHYGNEWGQVELKQHPVAAVQPNLNVYVVQYIYI
ncbi:hypothetical protein QE152_g15706 [Popillia japonica]|uniref:Uncharacterized protein n=1 Tax=Popillia japonica TaxID=7064 RepID=A0AAW1L6W1_POPJA